MKKFMTARQAAQTLEVEIQHVYKLLWANKLAGRKLDGCWLVSTSSITARKKQLGDKRNGTRNHHRAAVPVS